MKWYSIAFLFICLAVIGGIMYVVSLSIDIAQPVWRDFGTVQNLHNIAEWSDQLNIARYYQTMTIQTDSHAGVLLDTGPNGNWCSGMTIFSCGSGSVAWQNGTRVFIEERKDWKFFVGAIEA